MGTRQSEIITISVPPGIAKAYRMMARARSESASALFREMFERFRKESLAEELAGLQSYGAKKAAEAGITEKDVERLVFGDR
jgi:hypothetical protein